MAEDGLRGPGRSAALGLRIVLAALGMLLVAGAAHAEDPGREEDRLRRGDRTRDALQDAQADAEALIGLDGEAATWADVLARPDDVETSFRWARQQVRAGRLRAAAATLERILLLRPDLSGVRLLHAVVLYRLDSLVEAERELLTLSEGPLTATQRAEVERYLDLVRRSTRRTRVGATVSFGTTFETNRNSAPASGTRLIQLGNTRLELDLLDASREQDDVAFFGLTELAFEHDLGFHEGHLLVGSVSTYLSQQLDLGDFNSKAYAFDFGGRYRGGRADVTAKLFGSWFDLSSETFLKTGGLDLSVERSETPRLGQRAGVRVEWQDFDAIRQSVTSNEHTGLRVETGVGGTWRPSPTHQLDADFIYLVKDARGSSLARTNDVFSRDGPELRIGHTWLLGQGRFLVTQVLAGRDSYWRADRRISTKRRRRDVRTRANVTFGLPLGSLLPGRAGRARETLSGVVLSIGADYYRVDSNLPNYEFDDVKVTLAFSRQFSLY